MKKVVVFSIILLSIQYANAQWVQTGGPPGGGNVNALVVAGENLLAATRENGVFISPDYGTSWSQVNFEFGYSGPNSFCLAGEFVFAATWAGIFRSSDNGFNWEEANIGMPSSRSVTAMVVNGSTMIVGTSRGSYFISENYGDTWLGVSLAYPIPNALAVCNNDLFAGSAGNGVLLSKDNGTTWTEVNNGLSDLTVQSLAVIGSTIFAGTYQGGVFISTDQGASWKNANSGLPNFNITALAVSGNTIYAITESGLFRSVNNGTSWTAINNGLPGFPVVISLATNGLNVFAGLDGEGVYFSGYAGNSWRPTNGLPCTIVKSLVANSTAIYAGTAGTGLFRSTDKGDTWTKSNEGIPDWARIDVLGMSGNTLFAGTSEGLYRSIDEGQHWTGSLQGWQIMSFAVDANKLYAGAYWGGVFVSSDDGTTWTQMNNGLSGSVSAIAVNGNILLAGTGSGVFRSSDNGNSWIPVNSGLNSQGVTSFVVVGSTIFAGTNGGIFKTTNNGTLWTQVSYGETRTLAVYGSVIFAGTYYGAIISSDQGSTWTEISEGLTRPVNAFSFSGNKVFAGTSGNGVYRNATIVTSTEHATEIIHPIIIYPNPANKSILFKTDEYAGGGFLSVCNLSGQVLLKQPVSQALTSIDIGALSDGMYVVRYENGNMFRIGRFVKN